VKEETARCDTYVYATIEGFIQTLQTFIRFSNNTAAITSAFPYSNHAVTRKYCRWFRL